MSFELEVAKPFAKLKAAHDLNCAAPDAVLAVALAAHNLLRTTYPKTNLLGAGGEYFTFGIATTPAGVSRPIRTNLFLADSAAFTTAWKLMVEGIGKKVPRLDGTNSALYTAIQSFAAAYDLFNRGARKTPGTFFEILLGSLLSRAITGKREKQVVLDVKGESATIPTDIYFPDSHLVVAAKISTRDRIIQAWSHQLLLDRIGSYLKLPPFRSILCAVGEVQLGKKANQPYYTVTVQNQVVLYQQHVAKLTGLYYLDPPKGYLALDAKGILSVRTIGDLLHGNLP